MFRLESKRLKREFKNNDGNFYASQIVNSYSNMNFIPDGNGSEFVIKFADGSEVTSKGLPVENAGYEGDKLVFDFTEDMGVKVTLKYWVHKDGNTVCKQIIINQSTNAVIDYVDLECVGIINSKTHFCVDVVEGGEIPAFWSMLGQPVYVDSLFFGCEFPATENRIIHGNATVRYYIGSSVGSNFVCPVTVMGAGPDNTLAGVRNAFYEYIDFISVPAPLRFQYNSWYDYMKDITEDNIMVSFAEVHKQLTAYGAPKLDAYVVDDGWPNTKAGFWSFNKKFPNKLTKVTALCNSMDSHFGLWLGPRGGYTRPDKIAKRMQRAGNGYLNKQAKDICVASSKYVEKLGDFLVDTTNEFDIDYWKLDGFCLAPCENSKHDHAVGGYENMYFVTDMWQKWIRLYERLRTANPKLWINMTCYVNVSPWWLQWVNSLWVQNSGDIGFAKNIENQAQVDKEITYRDARYYDCLCKRALQIPLKNLYNHEPIYGNTAHVNYTDEEFEKYIYWCTVRGQALNELHLSVNMMNESKWTSLSEAMNWQKDNFHILKNAQFIGGNPEENNIYGYISWTPEGEGIIAMRNPNNEETSLTLTFNKLMGTPQSLKGAKCFNVYCKSMPETDETYDYNSKMDLTMKPFEVMIFKIAKER